MSQVLDVILCNRNLASSFDRLVGVSEHSQRFVALPAPRRRAAAQGSACYQSVEICCLLVTAASLVGCGACK
jgi:hypothetical protein